MSGRQAHSEQDENVSCDWHAVLMGQAQIYWDMEQYSKVQSILQQSADFCSEHEAWKLNSAHAHFMQGGECAMSAIFVMSSCLLHFLMPALQVSNNLWLAHTGSEQQMIICPSSGCMQLQTECQSSKFVICFSTG